MKLRRTLIGAALAVATTLGMTVPLAAPASAASCTEVQSAQGSTARPYRSNELDVTSTLKINVADCAGWRYRYTVYLFEGQKIYGSSVISGTTAFGTAHPPTFRSAGLEVGNTQVGFGYKTEVYDLVAGTWSTVNKHAWYIETPGSFNTATGENVSPYPYSGGGSGSCVSYAYQPPCLPFF